MDLVHEELQHLEFNQDNRAKVNQLKTEFDEMLKKLLTFEMDLGIRETHQSQYTWYKGLSVDHSVSFNNSYKQKKRGTMVLADRAPTDLEAPVQKFLKSAQLVIV